MRQKIEDAIIAAFIADALSLGVHWVYETSVIEQKYGRLEDMVTPVLAPYHQNKKKGEFTHYGDQMLVLLESVTKTSGFDLNDFSDQWQEMFAFYSGYLDHATEITLERFRSGKSAEESGSESMDLAGAVRIPPLFLNNSDDLEGLIKDARQQTAMTHNQTQVIDIAEWMTRTAVFVLNGETPSNAMFMAIDDMPETGELAIMVEEGFKSRTTDTREAIINFGQMCSFNTALPSAVHLIAKYENNFKEAMIENILSGGDSAARGILSGFIIGCHTKKQSIPAQWLQDMSAYLKISKRLQIK